MLPCDVTSDSQLDAVFAAIDAKYGGLDFLVHGVAFADREDLARPFSDTSRDGFGRALDISVYSLVALSRRAAPLMDKRGGGSIVTLSYLGGRARLHQLQRDGRGQGGAGIVGPVSRVRARARETSA